MKNKQHLKYRQQSYLNKKILNYFEAVKENIRNVIRKKKIEW